jgi:hypothetical protein
MSARNGQDWQHNKSSNACVKVPRLATSQLEQYLRKIAKTPGNITSYSSNACVKLQENSQQQKKKGEEIPTTNCQDWHHNKSSTACVQLPRLTNNKHFTTILSYRNFILFLFH